MSRKYELTDQFQDHEGIILFRIRAVKDFMCSDNKSTFLKIKEGDLGGWIESEENLSQDDTCWVDYNAMVFDDAYVCEKAIIKDNAKIFGGAFVHGNAIIKDNAEAYGRANIYGNAIIKDNAAVYDNAIILGNAIISDDAWVHGNAYINDDAIVRGNAQVYGNATVEGEAKVYGEAQVSEYATVNGSAEIYGFAKIEDNAIITESSTIMGSAIIRGYAFIEGHTIVDPCENKFSKSLPLVIEGDTYINCDSRIQDEYDFFTFKLPWLSFSRVTWALGNWTFHFPSNYTDERYNRITKTTDRGFRDFAIQKGLLQLQIAFEYVSLVNKLRMTAEKTEKAEQE